MSANQNTAPRRAAEQPKRKKAKITPIRTPRQQARQRARETNRKAVAVVAIVLILFAAAFPSLYTSAQIAAVNNEINGLNEDIAAEQGRTIQLEMQLESKISLDNVEKYVQQMGMVKVENNQIEYIRLHDEDKIENDSGGGIARWAAELKDAFLGMFGTSE